MNTKLAEEASLKNNLILTFLLFASFTWISFAQPVTERYKALGELFVPEFSSAPFPHPQRINGHVYDNKTFSKQEHYNDSSVAIFIPKGFKPSAKTNIVVYFHGWNNNIDSACAQYKLIEQFSASNKNAIFVFPEGPKNSPDSYGGRLEEKDGLKNLIDDVLKFLTAKGKLHSTKAGNIILAGHSGAFRVISFCLMRGGLTQNISDVILFDALYGQTEKYSHWIEKYKGRFIDIYTDGGGTKNETESLMNDLDGWGIPYFKTEEKDLKPDDLLNNRLLFIHTDLTHNDVIAVRQQFLNYLTTSKLPEIKK
ncbi:MAG: hypothetical protein WCS69_00395 [Ignavibacteriaceae bacterium]|jgi:hypothetical protein